MALVECPDCGLRVSESAASCMSCGRPMLREAAADAETASAWFLHAHGGRTFGPLAPQEIRGYFTAGMVRAHDMVSGPGLPEAVPASEAAAFLQVPAPPAPPPPRVLVVPRQAPPTPPPAAATVTTASPGAAAPQAASAETADAGAAAPPAATPAEGSTAVPPAAAPANAASTPPSPPAPRPLAMTEVPPSLAWHWVALWLVALFGVQLALIPSHSVGAHPSLAAFVATASMRYAGTVAASFLIALVAGWLLFRVLPGRRGALAAMTLAYAGLAVHHYARESQPPGVQVPASVAEDARTLPGDGAARSAVAARDAGHAGASPRPLKPAVLGEPAELPSGPSVGRRDWHGFAEALTQRSDWSGLASLSRDWVRAEPDSPTAWTYLGIAHAELGDYGQAIDANQRALRIDPDYVTALYNLANNHKSQGDNERALAGYRRVIELKPDAVSAYNNMAIVLSRLHRSDEAIATWNRATQIDPGDARNWSNLGQQYYNLRQYASAAEMWRKALTLDPADGTAKVGLENVLEMQRLGR